MIEWTVDFKNMLIINNKDNSFVKIHRGNLMLEPATWSWSYLYIDSPIVGQKPSKNHVFKVKSFPRSTELERLYQRYIGAIIAGAQGA